METKELFGEMTDERSPFKWVEDLTQSGRILIAGCSGSGKSVALKDIIYTLMAKDANHNQFVFIDLKRVELKVFRNAPHTLAYVTEPDQVEETLNKVLLLIDSRYRKMAARDELKSSDAAVWVVIDEYADLMTTCGKKVERLVQRIAQIGRASAVNIILCTQSPLATIVTTAIKTNFNSRLACRTVCPQDSRNILSVKGAEELPDYGKAIMQINGRNTKIDIPFLEQEELKALVDYWNRNTAKVEQKNEEPGIEAVDRDKAVLNHILSALYGCRKAN